MKQFTIFDGGVGETIGTVELTDELLQEVIDPDKLTLASLKNGGMITLIPQEESGFLVGTLRRLKHLLDELRQPAISLHSHIGLTDGVIEGVKALFREVEFIRVKTKEELEELINTSGAIPDKFERVKYPILRDLYGQVTNESD